MKHPTEMSKYRVGEIVKGILDEIELQPAPKPKVTPRYVNEIHSERGMIRLEAGYWFAYPRVGDLKHGPYEAYTDAEGALEKPCSA